MKKLTAFLAVVALGLLTTLTASAQIHYSVTKLGTTPAALSANGVKVTTAPTMIGFATNDFNPVYVSGTNKSVDLGYLYLEGTSGLTDGSFTLSTAYDLHVWTDSLSFDTTTTININYNVLVDLTPTVSLSNPQGRNTVVTNITTSPLAVYNFTYGGYGMKLTFVDDSTSQSSRDLDVANGGSKLQLGNYGVKGTLVFNAVPEPSTYALMGASGLAALVGFRRFRSKKANKA